MTPLAVIRFVGGRLLGAALTIWVTTVIVFGALYVVPGDPLSILLRGRRTTPELVAQLRETYGLDEPLPVRYATWLSGVVRGDFGESLQFQASVADVVASRIPTTLWLVGYSAVIILVFGVVLGSWAAVSRRPLVDQIVLIGSSVLSAIPAFVAALILLLVFAGALGWFPAFGSGGDNVTDRLYHLTLPAIALSLTYVGLIARITRASLLREIRSDHVVVARTRGLPRGYVFRHHVMRNALNPILSYAGVLVAGLLVTSQLVEFAFDLNGIGSLLVESVRNIDFAVVQALTLLIVIAFIVTNLFVDLLAPVIDPELRRGAA
ncbi:ABC transporter permease [Microbacterium sp. CCNWLW134]|uniref:ABC transporter permease n=1 Tax=Microbacterium sp. CCNWLW134 TaxID=3122064 RepID=UPI00301016C8